MRQDYSAFQWGVCRSGYKWVEGISSESSYGPAHIYLVGNLDPGNSNLSAEEVYRPLEDQTTLFLKLANTPHTQAGIESFAEEYGMLGGSCGQQITIRDEHGNQQKVYGESFDSWVEQIGRMHKAINLAMELRGIYDTPTELTSGGEHNKPPIELKGLEQHKRDFSMSTTQEKLFLLKLINSNIQDAVSIYLMDIPDGVGCLYMAPQSLLAALWLQLAKAISEGRKIRRCRTCGALIEIKPGVGRKDKNFCSANCRARYHNKSPYPSKNFLVKLAVLLEDKQRPILEALTKSKPKFTMSDLSEALGIDAKQYVEEKERSQSYDPRDMFF